MALTSVVQEVGELVAQRRCRGWKLKVRVSIHLFRYFCCRMYRLATAHNAQRYRRTDGRTDDIIMPIADHTDVVGPMIGWNKLQRSLLDSGQTQAQYCSPLLLSVFHSNQTAGRKFGLEAIDDSDALRSALVCILITYYVTQRHRQWWANPLISHTFKQRRSNGQRLYSLQKLRP